MSIESLQIKMEQWNAELNLARRSVRIESQSLEQTKERLQTLSDAQVLVQSLATQLQETAHEQVSQIVTKCLSAIFEEDAYTFKIHFERKRGKTEAVLLFERDGKEIDPTSAAGGGAVDVASFALRLAALILSRPQKRKLLVLDEPFRFLSAEYRPKVRKMIEQLSSELRVQFILVTHAFDLICGTIIEL